MKIVDIYQAKTDLSKLVNLAMHGEQIIITKAGKPVAQMTSMKPVRKIGVLKGKIKIANDFDADLSII